MKTFYIYTNQTKDGNGEITQYIRDYLNLKAVCAAARWMTRWRE